MYGDPENPTLVLVHGFGGSGALYYRVINGLAANFYLIIVDLPGMGSSSRQRIHHGFLCIIASSACA